VKNPKGYSRFGTTKGKALTALWVPFCKTGGGRGKSQAAMILSGRLGLRHPFSDRRRLGKNPITIDFWENPIYPHE